MSGFETLLDRLFDDLPGGDTAKTSRPGEHHLPKTAFQAALRGIRGRCPRCGVGRLFPRLLKPAKGAIIAMQWWMGLDDFEKPIRPAKDRSQDRPQKLP